VLVQVVATADADCRCIKASADGRWHADPTNAEACQRARRSGVCSGWGRESQPSISPAALEQAAVSVLLMRLMRFNEARGRVDGKSSGPATIPRGSTTIAGVARFELMGKSAASLRLRGKRLCRHSYPHPGTGASPEACARSPGKHAVGPAESYGRSHHRISPQGRQAYRRLRG